MKNMRPLKDEKIPMKDGEILADSRWIGLHGIGRFARNVISNTVVVPWHLKGRPSSPLDGLFLALRMLFLSSKAIYFSPGYNFPFFCRQKFIITVHDLNHIDRPENSSPMKRIYYNYLLRRACARAAKVFTVSEFSKKRIVEWARLNPEHVVNVGNGVESYFSPVGDCFSPGYRYFFCVGNRKFHKNEARVLRAFAALKADIDFRLVFTGAPSEELNAIARELEVDGRIKFLGSVSDNILASLYRGSECLVFPSLYEGFGLPVVEAMACGVPVITSNGTSLSEISGGAAILVDPESIEEISAGMNSVISDPQLKENLVRLGLVRASQFSWDAVYERVNKEFEVLTYVG